MCDIYVPSLYEWDEFYFSMWKSYKEGAYLEPEILILQGPADTDLEGELILVRIHYLNTEFFDDGFCIEIMSPIQEKYKFGD